MYLHLPTTTNGSGDAGTIAELNSASDAHWKSRKGQKDDDTTSAEVLPFLSTSEGAMFLDVFKALRIPYIINDLASAKMLEQDNIIPSGSLSF